MIHTGHIPADARMVSVPFVRKPHVHSDGKHNGRQDQHHDYQGLRNNNKAGKIVDNQQQEQKCQQSVYGIDDLHCIIFCKTNLWNSQDYNMIIFRMIH